MKRTFVKSASFFLALLIMLMTLTAVGAGVSAHLPGMTASHTVLPVIAVPVKRDNHDHEALWSNIKMPSGVPLATMPENGARNAALLAVEILALNDPELTTTYTSFRQAQHDAVIAADRRLNEANQSQDA